MQFTVDQKTLKRALKGCAKTVSHDQFRTGLTMAQITVTDETVTLTALDGIQLVQYKLPAQSTQPGTVLVHPKQLLSMIQGTKPDVTIETHDDDHISVTSAVKVTLPLPTPQDGYADVARIWPDPGRSKVRIAVNANRLSDVVQALAGEDGTVILEVPHNPLHPIEIEGAAKSGLCTRGIVCPVRLKT